MRNGVPVVPAPPREFPPVEPIGSPGDVEAGRGQIGNNRGTSKLDQKDDKKNSVKSLRLGGLELSSEDEADESCHNLMRKLCAMKVTWVIATLLTIVLCGAMSGPVVCKDLVSCKQYHHQDQDLHLYSALISAALAAVLLQEAAAVALTHNTARKAIHLIPNIKESLLPSVLLCITFLVLLVENLPFVIGDVPWFAHATNLNRSDLHEQPVYTIFYAEWIINVPILLVLAGSISLGRSAVEVGEPLLITNIYIVLAWVAHFIPNVPLRYTVVSVSFLMYFRASWIMCMWVVRWRRRHPDCHILGRPLLSFVLIIVFGIYGLVYLGRLHGLVSYRNERIFFTTMNFTTKLFASMTLAGIRSSEFQEVLLTMLANTQTSFKRAVNYEDHTPLLSD